MGIGGTMANWMPGVLDSSEFKAKWHKFIDLQKNTRRRYIHCLYPGCSKRTIYSHTVALRSLRQIQSATCKVVESAQLEPHAQTRICGHAISVVPNEVGVRRASAYTLFCQTHDQHFVQFDNSRDPPDMRTAFLAAYRSFCLEYFKKETCTPAYNARDEIFSLPEGVRNDPIAKAERRVWDGGHAVIREVKSRLDNAISRNDWSVLRHVYISLEGEPAILASGAASLELTFDGKLLASPYEDEATMVAISSRAFEKRTDLLFSILGSCHFGRRYIGSIERLKANDVARTIPFVLLDLTENCYMNPDWFNALRQAESFQAVLRMQVYRMSGLFGSPRVTNWRVARRKRLVDLVTSGSDALR